MTSDIRISVCFRNHRKRKKLKRILGDGYLDYLVDFWIGVSLHRSSGELSGWDDGDIADEAGWLGEPDVFVSAMIESGLLEKAGDVYYCHDWENWQGWVCGAEARSEKAKKAAKARWDKRNGDATSNA